jgi:phosphoglycerol transferase MdoB-like AlkP superfamily enzyme
MFSSRAARLLLVQYVNLLGAWVALFLLFRLILVIATWSFHGDATSSLLVGSFVHGLLFDLSMGARLAAPFALWMIWRPEPAKTERRVVLGLFGLLAFLCIFALVAEVEFYKEFQVRLGPLALEYIGKPDDNKTIAGMIWHGYPVVRWMTTCFVIWGLFLWLGKWLLKPRVGRIHWQAQTAATILLAAVTVIGSRGGFRGSPLRWGDAVFSGSAYANAMAHNGVFALVDTVRHAKRGTASTRWRKSMPEEQAFQIARAITLENGETPVHAEEFPLLHHSEPSHLELRKRPQNVVVVMMESFSARFCGATGAGYGATPNFDQLASEGILFDRAFSISTHTAQGVYGTLCSFPNLPDYDNMMKHTVGAQEFSTLPSLLEQSGFDNVFLYNGLFSWDNKEGFFRGNGVERFIGRYDYSNPVFVDPDWGVSDLDVFRRANQEFSDLAAHKRRFLGMILTLSNHAPFNLPKPEGLEWIKEGGDQNKRINGVHYADWALGEFIKEARKTTWFDDTLFVFVGDHGFGIAPVLTEAGLLHHHVPLLFYGPGIFGGRHEVRHQVASQMDIKPTILGLMGLEVLDQSFGRDLFSLPDTDPGHAYVKASGSTIVSWIEGNQILVTSPGKPPRLHSYDLSFPPHASEDLAPGNPDRVRALERQLRAFVVAGLTALQTHKCAL